MMVRRAVVLFAAAAVLFSAAPAAAQSPGPSGPSMPGGLGTSDPFGQVSSSGASALVGSDYDLSDVDPLSGALLGTDTSHALSDSSATVSDMAEQQALAVDVLRNAEAARRAAEERRRAELEKKRREEAERKRRESGGGSSGAPAGAQSSGSGSTRVAAGIRVDVSIADNVERLVAAAAADGVSLSGWGWRDGAAQIRLRTTNGCPDVYTAPASSCRVPTARPGQSMHERGLAIDFKNCSTRSTACYKWLAANASRFGLFNLPVEPWHWSTNGK